VLFSLVDLEVEINHISHEESVHLVDIIGISCGIHVEHLPYIDE
jgi:hypothetical protein